MKTKEFLQKLYEELEIESVNELTLDIELQNLDEWDSLLILVLISFIESEFNVNLTADEINDFEKVSDLTDKLNLED